MPNPDKSKNGNPLEKEGGRYCNLEPKECKNYGGVFSDDGGYICALCGGRVSKWLPLAHLVDFGGMDQGKL